MRKAFVFGKFLPFHKGHEAMIRFALEQCDFLSVMICASDREDIPGEVRKEWIRSSFIEHDNVEIRLFDYKEDELPNSSVSSRSISKVWADTFLNELPGYNLLISSEVYGEYVAEYMKIKHLPFDPERKQFPIAASSIRNDLLSGWRFLPKSVKPYFAKKVIVLGTESTGKSTLCKRLATHFSCSLVEEAGRDLISNSNEFTMEDLGKVAIEHSVRIEKAMVAEHPLIIIDTDIHITQSYAKYFFNRDIDINPFLYQVNKASLYLYLSKDCPYVQDGTRLNEEERNSQDESHQQTLKEAKIDYLFIEGDWDERFTKAIVQVEKLIKPA